MHNCERETGRSTAVPSVFLLLFLIAGGCSSDERKKLIVYSPHGKEMLKAAEDSFEAKYPSVDVQWQDMGGQDAFDRIRTERNNPQASVWWGGSSVAFALAADEGLLEPFEPTWAAFVSDDARDNDGRWFGTFYTPEVIAFNSTVLSRETAPQDWDDLLKDEWKDRILIRYPLQSATMRTIYGAMIQRAPTPQDGYRWLAKLDRNVKTYAANPIQLYLGLARGEGDVTVWNLPDIRLQSDQNGYPFDYVFPPSGTPVLTDGIALVAGAKNLDLARDFYEHVTSDSAMVDQASRFYRIPVRTDVPKEKLPEWIVSEQFQAMEMDWLQLSELGPTWMQFWDENIKGNGVEFLESD
ncbi:MAG: extracellular solute-binding protein [Rhodothermales bacterium]|nr:extracellular solute-binding protein [Rhodothermales bacterium]